MTDIKVRITYSYLLCLPSRWFGGNFLIALYLFQMRILKRGLETLVFLI